MSETSTTTSEFLTVGDVAIILAVSVNTVARQFAALPGTIDTVASKEKMNKRQRRQQPVL
jgi:hypothetical protein